MASRRRPSAAHLLLLPDPVLSLVVRRLDLADALSLRSACRRLETIVLGGETKGPLVVARRGLRLDADAVLGGRAWPARLRRILRLAVGGGDGPSGTLRLEVRSWRLGAGPVDDCLLGLANLAASETAAPLDLCLGTPDGSHVSPAYLHAAAAHPSVRGLRVLGDAGKPRPSAASFAPCPPPAPGRRLAGLGLPWTFLRDSGMAVDFPVGTLVVGGRGPDHGPSVPDSSAVRVAFASAALRGPRRIVTHGAPSLGCGILWSHLLLAACTSLESLEMYPELRPGRPSSVGWRPLYFNPPVPPATPGPLRIFALHDRVFAPTDFRWLRAAPALERFAAFVAGPVAVLELLSSMPAAVRTLDLAAIPGRFLAHATEEETIFAPSSAWMASVARRFPPALVSVRLVVRRSWHWVHYLFVTVVRLRERCPGLAQMAVSFVGLDQEEPWNESRAHAVSLAAFAHGPPDRPLRPLDKLALWFPGQPAPLVMLPGRLAQARAAIPDAASVMRCLGPADPAEAEAGGGGFTIVW